MYSEPGTRQLVPENRKTTNRIRSCHSISGSELNLAGVTWIGGDGNSIPNSSQTMKENDSKPRTKPWFSWHSPGSSASMDLHEGRAQVNKQKEVSVGRV